jgi:hypothetical protein
MLTSKSWSARFIAEILDLVCDQHLSRDYQRMVIIGLSFLRYRSDYIMLCLIFDCLLYSNVLSCTECASHDQKLAH